MVVDTNMGFNKVNANVESYVQYQVSIEGEGRITSRVTVTYRNQSGSDPEPCVQQAVYPPTYAEMMEGCYWDYLRIYVPEGSELLESPQLTLPEGSLRAREGGETRVPLTTDVGPAELGKDVYGVFFVVAPGERRELVFEYQQPSSVVAGEQSKTYRLVVQKQPGTLAVTLRLGIELPPGSSVTSTEPEASSLDNGRVVFETDLRQDREFEVTFRR
jgi:hypothetical protein